MMAASRLAQRQRPPGFIHLPPAAMMPPPSPKLASRNGHAGLAQSSDAGNNNIMHSPSSNMHLDGPPDNVSAATAATTATASASVGAAAATPGDFDAVSPHIPINTAAAASSGPVAIPPPPRITSPYYSPSQIFPPSSTNKSYFPTYLCQSPQSQRANPVSAGAHRPSPLGTPSAEQQQQQYHHQPPKTPRSPSFFTGGLPTSPRSPLVSIEHPTSPFDNSSMHPPSGITSSPLSHKARTVSAAARTYHNHLAQQQLAFQMQQRELIFQATRANTAMGPISPRLLPLGSPGPVTPLTLEDNPAGYLVVSGSGLLTTSQVLQLQQQHLEKLAAAAAAAEKEAADEEETKPSQ